MQYLGGTATPFRTRFYNYKSGARKLSKAYLNKCNVYQEQFHLHFNSEGHSGIKDWKITITAFIPNKLNERFVDILMLYICFKFLLRAFIAFAT